MKRLFISLSLICIAVASFAQGVTGDWYGLLKVPGGQLHLVMHVTKTDAGYTATMDSPDQKALGIPMDKVSFIDNQLAIGWSAGGMTYTGTFLPDSNKVNGTFKQGPGSYPLNLSREKSGVAADRPQDPKEFPYHQEEVQFTNSKAGNQLFGTLTLPSTGKPKRIVVLISGSGPQNRNSEVALINHRPFLVLSDYLTRNGIGVLRYDDRGVGKSNGDFSSATSADFADDAEAGVNYILSRPDLKSVAVGLIGHSEGGMIAPMVAARNKNVKFVVLLAGPGIPITELMVKQNEDMMLLGGANNESINTAKGTIRTVYGVVISNPTLSNSLLKQKIDSTLSVSYLKTNTGGAGGAKLTSNDFAAVLTPWFRYFLAYKPADNLVKLKCPVLALNGTLDKQVNAEANLAGIQAALTKAGNKRFEAVAMPGLNHLFQTTSTGSPNEYAELTETFSPVALAKVTTWINQL